jgi:hypothetical protein
MPYTEQQLVDLLREIRTHLQFILIYAAIQGTGTEIVFSAWIKTIDNLLKS